MLPGGRVEVTGGHWAISLGHPLDHPLDHPHPHPLNKPTEPPHTRPPTHTRPTSHRSTPQLPDHQPSASCYSIPLPRPASFLSHAPSSAPTTLRPHDCRAEPRPVSNRPASYRRSSSSFFSFPFSRPRLFTCSSVESHRAPVLLCRIASLPPTCFSSRLRQPSPSWPPCRWAVTRISVHHRPGRLVARASLSRLVLHVSPQLNWYRYRLRRRPKLALMPTAATSRRPLLEIWR